MPDDTTDTSIEVRRGGRGRFEKGTARPEGAGRQEGNRWPITLIREKRQQAIIEEMRQVCTKLRGLSVDEIFNFYEFDPLAWAIMSVQTYEDDPQVQFKFLELLIKLKYPAVKSVETRSATVSESRVQVSFGRDFPEDQRAAATAAVIGHEQVIPAIDLGSGEAPEKAKRPRGRPRKERP